MVVLAQILSLSLFSLFIFQLGRFAQVRRETPSYELALQPATVRADVVRMPRRARQLNDLPRAS